MLQTIDNISSWVNESDIDQQEQGRRHAIHVLLSAISSSELLRANMAMKGGVLLAIRYRSPRYTTDVDFSTMEKLSDIKTGILKRKLSENLISASEKLPYDMSCAIQGFRQKPPNPDATWPTFQIKIGYAYKHEPKKYRRLLKGNSSQVIKIDYSFNEMIIETEPLILSEEEFILTYSYTDLLAEKYRALLQQEVRNRSRSQDVYDIYHILTNFDFPSEPLKSEILKALIQKSKSRNINPNKNSLSAPEIKDRSQRKYKTIQHDIYGDLPEFEHAYAIIQEFYENLPW